MRPTPRHDRRPLTLPVALAAAMCLCAAAGVDARSTLRPVTFESHALVQLVTRIAEAARQVRPHAAVQPPHERARATGGLEVPLPEYADARLAHLPPLREALHNLPPPAHA